MCAYGSVNGTNICSDAGLYQLLRSWGFSGFVRSDLAAVRNPAAAFGAGLDVIKPVSVAPLTSLVETGAIPMADLDAAVTHTLTAMFAFGLIASPRPPDHRRPCGHHRRTWTWPCERPSSSMVLLKDKDHVLPLSPATPSVAVIGSDAGAEATTTGRGSSQVRASSIVTPVRALEAALGRNTRISYTPADSPRLSLPPIPSSDLIGSPLPTQTPIRDRPTGQFDPDVAGPATQDLHLAFAPNVTRPPRPPRAPGPARVGRRGRQGCRSLSAALTSSRSSRTATPGWISTARPSSPARACTVARCGRPRCPSWPAIATT